MLQLKPSPPATGSVPCVDYDLHGIVGIRLIGATPHDRAAVTRQLGPIEAPLAREPDIVIRFVTRLETGPRLWYLGVHDAAFTEDAFLILRSRRKTACRVQIPFDQIGGPCEIVCESGLSAVPLLIPIINLTALGKGVVPVHAAAFTFRGTGTLVTGWSKGGKTETLLAFVARGAEYIGDEWIYLHAAADRMCGIPEPVTIWDWHLREMPSLRRVVDRRQRARLAALRATIRLISSTQGLLSNRGRDGVMHRLVPALQRQLFVHVPPERAFGIRRVPAAGVPRQLLFVASHAASEIEVRPASAQRIARRMVFSLQEERQPLLSFYTKYRFAFPTRINESLEQAESVERDLLLRAWEGLEAHEVYHPYPVAIPRLFDAVEPLFR